MITISAPLTIRVAVPLQLLLLAILIIIFGFAFNIPRAEQRAEAQVYKIFSNELNRLQGQLNYFIRHDKMEGVEREIASLSERYEYKMIALVDGNIVIAGSRKAWNKQIIGRINRHFEAKISEQATELHRIIITKKQNMLLAYVPISLKWGWTEESLRAGKRGIFFIQYDLNFAQAGARKHVLEQLWTSSIVVVLLALILWILSEFFLTRRVTKLLNASRNLAEGNLKSRSHLKGRDELAQIGQAFDSMAEKIESFQTNLAISEERLKLALESTNDGLWDWNIVTGDVYFSPRWETMLGYQPGDIEPNVKSWEKLVHPDDRDLVTSALNEHLQGLTLVYETEHRILTRSGQWIWVLDRGKVVARDESGNPLRATGTHTDITDKKRIELQLRQQALVLQQMSDSVITTDLNGKITDWNLAAERMFGYSKEEVLGKTRDILHQSEQNVVHQAVVSTDKIIDTVMCNGRWGGEITATKKDKTKVICETIVVPLHNEEGDLVATIGVHRDITERKASEERIKYMASHDSLTNLPNRALFTDKLVAALKIANENSLLAVMFIDLDGFKNVNDTFGHETGDELLKQVSGRLLSCVRRSDIVGRLGGDEFVILLFEITHKKIVSIIAQNILDSLSKPFFINKNKATIGASIGISLYPEHGKTSNELLKQADKMMYHVKKQGKNNYAFA